MANSLNKVTLIGNLGKDPDIRTMSNSKQLAAFSVATSESWIDKFTNERKEQTEWHNVVIFNEKLVEIAQKYLSKGSKVYIEGSLKTRKWVDSNNNERYTTEIILQFNAILIILDGRKEGDQGALPNNNSSVNAIGDSTEEIIDDEIPF